MNIRHTIASNRKSPNESVEYRGPRIAIGVVASLSRVRLLAASRSLLLTTPLDGGGGGSAKEDGLVGPNR